MNNKGLSIIGIGIIVIGIGLILMAVVSKPTKFAIDEATTENINSLVKAWVYDYGIVKVSGPTEAVAFRVTDADTDGWKSYEAGYGTSTVELTLRETGGKEVAVTSVHWTLYDANGHWVAYGTKLVDKTIAANGSTSVSISITLSEDDANQIEDADKPVDDFGGSGKLEFSVSGQDTEHAHYINSISGSADMTVAKG